MRSRSKGVVLRPDARGEGWQSLNYRAVTPFPLQAQRESFRAAAVAFVPELDSADSATWNALETVVAQALASRPPAIVRQLAIFLRLLGLLSRLRHGRSLARLAPTARAALFHRLERAPLLLLRRGIWGLRTLTFMGYYTQPAVVASLGYRAGPAGWEARR